MNSEIKRWLNDGNYLPECMRDFHDQKDIFKAMHALYEKNNTDDNYKKPNWVEGQVYVVDWFLWYIAQRGYTLQKSRKKLNFESLENLRNQPCVLSQLLSPPKEEDPSLRDLHRP